MTTLSHPATHRGRVDTLRRRGQLSCGECHISRPPEHADSDPEGGDPF